VQLRFGTFFDQGREGLSFLIASSIGESVNPEGALSASKGDGGRTEGSEVAFADAGCGGAFGPRSGCSTRAPGGASSVDTQEAKPAIPTHAASTTERTLQRVRFIAVLMAICMPR
jgi:hypothetical protein